VETDHNVWILLDPAHGADEYFIVENREPTASTYDQNASDSGLVIMRADVQSESALASSLVKGDTDQEGNFSYGVLAPGKYFVLTTPEPVDRSVDRINKLWARRSQAKDIEVTPSSTVQVRIEQ